MSQLRRSHVLSLAVLSALSLPDCDADSPGFGPSSSQLYALAESCPLANAAFLATSTYASASQALSTSGRANDIRLFAGRRVNFPDLGESVDYAWGCNTSSGLPEKVAVLTSSRKVVTEPEIQQMQLEARVARHGKVDPDLLDDVALVSAHTPILVHLWYESLTPQIERPSSPDDSFLQSYSTLRTTLSATQKTNAVAAARNHGAEIVAELKNIPCVIARIEAAQISSLVAESAIAYLTSAQPDSTKAIVLSAGYSSFLGADDNESAEQFASMGLHGTGVKAGVFEDWGGASLWTFHPAFADLSGYTEMLAPSPQGCTGQPDGVPCPYQPYRCYCRGELCYAAHVTSAASMMGARLELGPFLFPEIRGADQMHLYYANQGDTAQRLDWLAQNQVRVINSSTYGGGAAWKAAINYTVRENLATLTQAAGNDPHVAVYCEENTICVGNYSLVSPSYVDEWKTNPTNNPIRYLMDGETAYLDTAAHWDAERPDVVASGNESFSPTATSKSPIWSVDGDGTSNSAPMIAGQVAVLQGFFSTARYWPELVKALFVVAGYNHNVIGAPLSRSYPMQPLDEWDGGGVPTSLAIKTIHSNGWYRTLSLYPSSFNSNGDYDVVNVNVPNGQAIRVALGFMYCVEGGYSILKSDLDLVLVDDALGTSRDYSNSVSNGVEMLEWKNTTGSTRAVRLRVKLHGTMHTCNGWAHEYAGLAWAVYTPQW